MHYTKTEVKMEIFDGFISAIASEFKIPFHKNKNGDYMATLEFDNGRVQSVQVSLKKDESGDRVIQYLSTIASLKQDTWDLYKSSLQQNLTFDYGALALDKDTLVMHYSVLLENCEPRTFMKSLIYVAAKADEIEEMLSKEDIN